jgi:cephalosporin hydroxylase
MNDLERYFYNNTGRVIHKWRHYFEIYDRHFARFRFKPVVIVEIGVFKGGSLQMWKNYFGPNAQIYGIDVDPGCRIFEEEQVKISIGSQDDRQFLQAFARTVPRIDILIDDGGHTMGQQIATFEELYPHVDANGVYLCEDLHTSYWGDYGGGYKKPDTFVEYCKNFVDYLHGWHARSDTGGPTPLTVSDFTRTAHSVHFYDSVVVVEKRPMVTPSHLMTGREPQPN